MYEKIVRSRLRIEQNKKKEINKFYILTHKKHRREIFFEAKSLKALNFMKPKFKSPKKRCIYFFLKLGILQPFLKKIWLPAGHGNLIFVGGQIKVFNFEKSEVLSFCMPHEKKESFLRSRKVQKKMGALGFAPKVFKIDEKKVFSIEELLKSPEKMDEQRNFKKLIDYYGAIKIDKVQSEDYIEFLKVGLKKINIQDKYISKIFKLLQKNQKTLYLLNCHGDFAEGQILEKKGEIFFSDWAPYKNLITEDLSNYFRFEEDLLSNKKFLDVWKLYPLEVQKDLAYYFILCEIRHVIWKPYYLDRAKKRIKKLIGSGKI